jgi:hypothetical protein
MSSLSAAEDQGPGGPRAVLNSADSAPPPSLGNSTHGAVVEHALSISLDQADSLAAPQKPVDPSSLLSQRFLSLPVAADEALPQPAALQSPFQPSPQAGDRASKTTATSEIEPEGLCTDNNKTWHPSTPVHSPGTGVVAAGGIFGAQVELGRHIG